MQIIQQGAKVKFDDPASGPERGVVAAIVKDLTNGQAVARIELDEVDGPIVTIPVAELEPA